MLLTGLAAGVVYVVTLFGTFIYDDVDLLLNNPKLTAPNPYELALTTRYNDGEDNLYRPLISLSFVIQHQLHGATAWPYHLVNLPLHVAASMAVALLAFRISSVQMAASAGRAALLAGVLFAVHPVHVEAVAGIVGRAELICALAICLAMSRLLTPLTPAGLATITGCTILAILSKEQGLLIPALLAVVWLSMRRAHQWPVPGDEKLPGMLAATVCFVCAIYIAVRQQYFKFDWDRNFLDWTINPIIRAEGIDLWLLSFEVVGRYAVALVAPVRLSIDHGHAVITSSAAWTNPFLWIGLLSTIGIAASIVLAWKRRDAGWLIVLASLATSVALVMNLFVVIGTIYGERLMYLPSVFFCIGVALLMCRRRWMPAALWVIIALFACRTAWYASEWNDRLSFYAISHERQPRSLRIVLLYADELLAQSRADEAAAVLERGIAIEPRYHELYYHRARIELRAGRFDAARMWINRAVSISPDVRADLWMGAIDEAEHRARDSTAPPR